MGGGGGEGFTDPIGGKRLVLTGSPGDFRDDDRKREEST